MLILLFAWAGRRLPGQLGRCVLALFCGMTLISETSAANWLKRNGPAITQTAAPAPEQGHANYLRRLMRDAHAAAQRGDLATARRLAERAHKIAVTCQSTLGNAPDCSPDATAALAQQFGLANHAAHGKAPIANTMESSTSQISVNRQESVEITLLLDHPSESALPLPPAPAPMLAKHAGELTPITHPRIAQPARSSASRWSTAQSPGLAVPIFTQPWEAQLFQPAPISRVMRSSFLALQTDWLSDETNFATAIARLTSRSDREFYPPDAAPLLEESVSDPDVMTAIGHGGDGDWELDQNEEEHETNWDSAPALDDILPAEPAASVSAAACPNRGVIPLLEFLDSTVSPASREQTILAREDVPRMIETDFRTPSPAFQPTPPSIHVREEIAELWPESQAPAPAAGIVAAHPFRLDFQPQDWTTERITLAVGIALLTCGCMCFALSLKRA